MSGFGRWGETQAHRRRAWIRSPRRFVSCRIPTCSVWRVRCLVVGMVAIGCVLIAPAAGDAAWSAPEQLAVSRVWQFDRPQVASDVEGDGVVVWHREETLNETLNGVEASTQDVGGWSVPVVLRAPRGGGAAFPQVAMNSQGDAVATWEESSEDFRGIEVSRRPRAGSWERPVRLPGSAEGERPAVAVDKRGDTSIVYTGRVAGAFGVKLSVQRGRQGGWYASRVFAKSKFNPREPQVAVDSRGETIIAWISASENRSWAQAVILGPSGKPEGRVQTLSSTRGHGTELRLAANESGNAVLVWRQAGVKRRPIEVATRSSRGRFTDTVTVSRGDDIEPTATVEPNGEAAVLFTRILSTQPGTHEPAGFTPAITQTTAVEATNHHVHGRWTHPVPLATAEKNSTFAPQIAADPAGDKIMAVWTNARFRSTEIAAYAGEIEASAIAPGESWQSPVTISPPESQSPCISVSSNGQATATWVTDHESENSQSIDAAEYETAP